MIPVSAAGHVSKNYSPYENDKIMRIKIFKWFFKEAGWSTNAPSDPP